MRRWLDEGEDDALIERELPLTEVLEIDSATLWDVVMTTATPETSDDDDGGGRRIELDGRLALAVYGDKGGSADHLLEADSEATELYTPGQCDEFKVIMHNFKVNVLIRGPTFHSCQSIMDC